MLQNYYYRTTPVKAKISFTVSIVGRLDFKGH